ncbi:TetR/AcrR family transcriptional regulator [Streptomyces ovatisporus]|uniref:TetR/AcrR family transcriptional regulator n=1 Tax=Streptomyces ovatisporus TaxID=1128682 RepID=A0ABV9AAK6_9ACTN
MTDAGFVRARRPEQKEQRREAILAAARELGTESGVRNVTLGGVAQAVGLAKSNVVRYFGTREEIFLELAAAGWQEWELATQARLSAETETGTGTGTGATGKAAPEGAREQGGQAEARRTRTVSALAETLAERPFFCDLLSHTTTTLEHNISLEAARSFKYAAHGVISRLGAQVSAACPELSESEGAELVQAAAALAGTLYPVATPSPVLAELYAADPELAAACPRMLPTLHRAVSALAVGLPALRTPGA